MSKKKASYYDLYDREPGKGAYISSVDWGRPRFQVMKDHPAQYLKCPQCKHFVHAHDDYGCIIDLCSCKEIDPDFEGTTCPRTIKKTITIKRKKKSIPAKRG